MSYLPKKISDGVELILEGLGIDWKNDHNFKDTPQRVTRALHEFNLGLYERPDGEKTFSSDYNGIVFMKDIEAVGLCPHHLLPIEYKISFAYIPKGEVLGLSKIARIIKNLCARPVLQEDLTLDIIKYFIDKVRPLGVALVISGVHGCMKYRGLKEKSITKTAELYGAFLEQPEARQEFYKLIS